MTDDRKKDFMLAVSSYIEKNVAPKVLVVDDDKDMRELVSILLSRAGFTCCKAGSVSEAINVLVEGFIPDLVITDFHMEDLNGLDLFDLLKKREELAAIPVILMTNDIKLLSGKKTQLPFQLVLDKSTLFEKLVKSSEPLLKK